MRARGTLALTLLAALGSAVLMWWLYNPGADPSRIYYGTDTRAAGLLLGPALALVWRPGRLPASTRRGAGIALDLVGLVALGGLLHEHHPWLYRGGLQLVALGTAVVVAATVHPQARLLPWLLELPPLRWVGLRSYGIYLWHWPIFMVTRPGVDVPGESWQVQLLRFALALMLAGLSYTFVELPIRQGAIGRFWNSLRRRPTRPADTSATARSTPATGLLSQLTRQPQRWHQRWQRRCLARSLRARTRVRRSNAHSMTGLTRWGLGRQALQLFCLAGACASPVNEALPDLPGSLPAASKSWC